jgi:hypothetical protein
VHTDLLRKLTGAYVTHARHQRRHGLGISDHRTTVTGVQYRRVKKEFNAQ